MKTSLGEDIGHVHHVSHAKAPFELATNDDNPMVLTLRNTWYLIDNLSKQGIGGKSRLGSKMPKGMGGGGKWGTLFKGLKIGALALGGIALFSFGSEAIAGTHERDAEEDLEKEQEDKKQDSEFIPPIKIEVSKDQADTTQQAVVEANIEKVMAKPKMDISEIQDEAAKQSTTTTSPPTTPKPENKKVKSGTKEALSSKVSDKDTVTGKGSIKGESVDSAIARAARDAGEDVTWLRAMIHLESRGNPRAKSGQYLGLGQMGKSAWSDVQKLGGIDTFPSLTGGSDDPRYDPYTNALATAKLMGINRKSIQSAAKDAGYEKVTLGLLYAAHNVGAGSVRKILKESDSSKWDDKTKGYINNQASELKVGGVGNYLQNTENSMAKHYASANVNVSSKQVADASNTGVMSSRSQVQLASKSVEPTQQKATSPVINVPVQVAKQDSSTPAVKSRTKPKSTQQVASNSSAGDIGGEATPDSGGMSQPYSGDSPKLFRLKNGNMAVI